VALDLLLTQVEKKSGLPVGHIGIERRSRRTRPHQRRRDLRRVAPPRDDHLRPRISRQHRDACSRRDRNPEYRATTSTTSSADPNGRARQRAPVIDGPSSRCASSTRCGILLTLPHARLRRQMALTPTSGRAQRGLLTHQEQFDRALTFSTRTPGHRGRSQGAVMFVTR